MRKGADDGGWTMTTLDEVWGTVRGAREDGPDALAAMALSYGAAMVLGTMRLNALLGRLAGADELLADERSERHAAERGESAARSDYLAAVARADAACAERDRAREDVELYIGQRDAARQRAEKAERERDESRAAHDHTRTMWATVCRERDEAREGHRIAAKMATDAAAERDGDRADAERLRVELDVLADRLGAVTAQRDALRAAVEAWADADRTHDVIVRQRAVLSLLAAVKRGPVGTVTP
jgi:chromosome segregation ATPase